MQLVARYRVSLAVVLVALAATGAFLAYGLPRTNAPNERMVDLSRVHYYSPALVKRTFAAHGIHLRYAYADGGGVQTLSTNPTVDELTVALGPRSGQVIWGPKTAHEYDQPIGNLDVKYRGSNADTLAAVKAAVAALT